MSTLIESYVPVVKFHGLNTQKAIRSTSATAGIGYGTGAGAAVTQETTITTGVEINAMSGQITTVSSTLASQATAVFAVTNSAVEATDTIVLSTTYAGAGVVTVHATTVVDGGFSIALFNAVTATTALNAVVVINFAVIKAVAA